ncbi:MAG: hypothetical protein K0R98_1220 [Rickettsiaceae bacterium]|nr:hypothetical protein [Rickettsiaceae bacterium]
MEFTRPSALNDPFDIYIEDFPGINRDRFKQKSADLFFNLVTNDPQKAAQQYSIPIEKIMKSKSF